jgi:hypothetical protein
MDAASLDILAASGARVVEGRIVDFCDPDAELHAAAGASIAVPLDTYGVLELGGPDAADFLHGQVSCDVKGLSADRSTYGTYNSPKGRMLASFLLWRTSEALRMMLARGALESMQKRLKMFVLRAKVGVADRTFADVLIGASGPDAPAAVARTCGAVPSNRHDVGHFPGGHVVRIPGDRFLLSVSSDAFDVTWATLTATLRPAGSRAWDWLDIVNGIAFVTPATQDQFVPQMANMELIGGVDFKKGCYPGQEIVARTQYLGKLKRRMYLAHVDTADPPAAGDALYSEDTGDQANGLVAAAAPAPDGGWDCLAVVQTTSAEQSRVHLHTLAGPVLAFRALPYKFA